MRTEEEIKKLLSGRTKKFEKELNLQIRNGQGSTAVKRTLKWVLGANFENKATDSEVLQEIVSRGLISEEEVEELRFDLNDN